MPACTSISKRFIAPWMVLVLTGALARIPTAFAQDPNQGLDMSIPSANVGNDSGDLSTDQGSAPPIPSGTKKTNDPGLFDQASSPYLDYGDFNSSEDEDADTTYFQYGRFFGLSLGLGYEAATGNRGYLYQPAFPRFELKVHYWFDFQFALNLGIFFANHNFDYLGKNYSVKLIGYGVDFKYYFDVRDAAAALSFCNPFLIAGVGAISKSQTDSPTGAPDTDSSFSFSAGAGLEFPISYKKTYLIIEGRYHTQSFADTVDDSFKQRVPDLSGGFMTLMFDLLFTW